MDTMPDDIVDDIEIVIETLTGAGIEEALPALSALRVAVFRAWPYLYDGIPDYERAYLAEFAAAPDAVIVAARDPEGVIVGAATAAPLASHTSEFMPLFEQFGFDPATVYYLGESVLLPEYRGRGLGHAFFDAREAAARAAVASDGRQFETMAFCGVIRSGGDPRCPAGYRPLDAFWRGRGYRPVEGMIGNYDWQEIDGPPQEIPHPMQFWARPLA